MKWNIRLYNFSLGSRVWLITPWHFFSNIMVTTITRTFQWIALLWVLSYLKYSSLPGWKPRPQYDEVCFGNEFCCQALNSWTKSILCETNKKGYTPTAQLQCVPIDAMPCTTASTCPNDENCIMGYCQDCIQDFF